MRLALEHLPHKRYARLGAGRLLRWIKACVEEELPGHVRVYMAQQSWVGECFLFFPQRRFGQPDSQRIGGKIKRAWAGRRDLGGLAEHGATRETEAKQ